MHSFALSTASPRTSPIRCSSNSGSPDCIFSSLNTSVTAILLAISPAACPPMPSASTTKPNPLPAGKSDTIASSWRARRPWSMTIAASYRHSGTGGMGMTGIRPLVPAEFSAAKRREAQRGFADHDHVPGLHLFGAQHRAAIAAHQIGLAAVTDEKGLLLGILGDRGMVLARYAVVAEIKPHLLSRAAPDLGHAGF